MQRLFFILLSLFHATAALAKDLPQGEFLLTGPVFPGIQGGHIVPTFAHARIEGDQIHWSFMTSYSGDDFSCKTFGKCHRTLQTLTHRIAWDTTGKIKILKTNRKRGVGHQVERGEETHVYDALQSLLTGATLDLTSQGGTLTSKPGRRTSSRTVTLHPLSLEQSFAGLALALSFEESLARMDHCVLRQFAHIAAIENPTAIETQILAAAQYYADRLSLEDVASFYLISDIPADKVAEIETARANETLMSAALNQGHTLLRNDATLTDDALLIALQDIMTRSFAKITEKASPGFLDTLLTTDRANYLAALRHEHRFFQQIMDGKLPLTAVCSDIKLGG